MRDLAFWFDYSCPYAYFASLGLEHLARRVEVDIRLEPFLLGGVFRAVGTPQKLFATLSPTKLDHGARDLERWAQSLHADFAMPAEHPLRTVGALRATLLARRMDGTIDPRVVAAFYRAYWVENQPLSEPHVIARVLSSCGHDGASIVGRLDAARETLVAQTDRALSLGIFGAPAYVVTTERGTELIWGQDRTHLVVEALTGIREPILGEPLDARGREVTLYYDYASPFAYLGHSQVRRLVAHTGCRVRTVPVLLGGIFKAIGQADVPIETYSAAKQAHTRRDLERWASFWRVPFRFATRFPIRTVSALRFTLGIEDQDARFGVEEALFRAAWVDGDAIEDSSVLESLARPILGVEGARHALEFASSEAAKAALHTTTREALARGVFGAPTWCVGSELIWGQDRLPFVVEALRG